MHVSRPSSYNGWALLAASLPTTACYAPRANAKVEVYKSLNILETIGICTTYKD